MIDNKLLLLSGNDIPFVEGQLIIHQPRINEISYIGEDTFYTGCQYLNFSKENLDEKDKNLLSHLSDFEILMTILKDNKYTTVKKSKICMQLVLSLLFPDYKITFLPLSILLSRQLQDKTQERHLIDKDNFIAFKEIIEEIFCLGNIFNENLKYNPGGPQAKALVQKFKERQRKLAELKRQGGVNETKEISIISQYISILTVGEKKDINTFFQYTVYQLFDEFRRFKMKEEYDLYIQFKMAGAKDLEEIENWMKDIHSNNNKEDNFV